MRSRLNLLHPVLGFWNLLRQPGDGILKRPELPAVGQRDRFIEAA
jgi:hypothetical protein